MPISGDVVWRSSAGLDRHLAAIQARAKMGSEAHYAFNARVRRAVIEDHKYKLMRSVDGRGRPLVDLASKTLANPRRRPGGPLCSGGLNARFITHFVAKWQNGTVYSAAGSQQTLVCYFEQLLSRATRNHGPRPFAQYHLTGASKPGTAWILPKRDVSGITPLGWIEIQKAVGQFWRDLVAQGDSIDGH